MNNLRSIFESITKTLSEKDLFVNSGKMMSSPGIKYRDKVFAFYFKESMGFRLGPNFDPLKAGLLNAKKIIEVFNLVEKDGVVRVSMLH